MKKNSLFLALLTLSFNAAYGSEWVQEDLSFAFESKANPVQGQVLRDEWIKMGSFEAEGQKDVNFVQYRMIFGDGSLSIFDALNTDEVAGLKRVDAKAKIQELEKAGKTEKDGAFIAGLTNVQGRELFMFFNLKRMKSSPGYAVRLLAHEPLHMARFLITTFLNPNVDYFRDPYTQLDDDNEEFFGETAERVSAIAWDRYQRLTGSLRP